MPLTCDVTLACGGVIIGVWKTSAFNEDRLLCNGGGISGVMEACVAGRYMGIALGEVSGLMSWLVSTDMHKCEALLE